MARTTTGSLPTDLKQLKAQGIIKERDDDLFTVRLRVPGGRLPVQRLKDIALVAERHGGDYVHLTVRQSLELVGVDRSRLNDVVNELADVDQEVAVCGARVRVPVACGGCEYNPHGLVDTQQAALAVDRELCSQATGHHKFKVGFSGCPHDCPKSAINDVGCIGVVAPELRPEACVGCGTCSTSCREGAISEGADRTAVYHPERCLLCGDCIKGCPTVAWRERRRGYAVYVGGKWGRQPQVGTLVALFVPEDTVVPFIAAVLHWYRTAAEGRGRIRIGQLLVEGGTKELLDHLRQRYPDLAVRDAELPTVVETRLRGAMPDIESV